MVSGNLPGCRWNNGEVNDFNMASNKNFDSGHVSISTSYAVQYHTKYYHVNEDHACHFATRDKQFHQNSQKFESDDIVVRIP